MKKIFGKLALIALLSVIPLSTASAYSINAIAGNPTGNSQGTIIFDFDTSFPVLSGDYFIVAASALPYPSNNVSGVYARPLDDATAYISVPYPQIDSTNFADLEIGFYSNYLGLYWGSIDTYNSISFYKDDIFTGETITGSQVTIPGPANGNQTFPGTNLYVNISGLLTFDEIRVTSTSMAFEFDNIAANPVPEPATMLLFGAGLLGLAGVARRKRS